MPVWKVAELPSIDAAPRALTETFPALPDPVVMLTISPLARIVRVPAATATSAARPGPAVTDPMAVSGPGSMGPATNNEPALTAIGAALPVLWTTLAN